MAINFKKQVRVYAYYTEHRSLSYTVDRDRTLEERVFLSELSTSTVEQANVEARRRFGLQAKDVTLEFVVIATNREEDTRFRQRKLAEEAAMLVRESEQVGGQERMTLTISGRPVTYPKVLTDIGQSGTNVLFRVEAHGRVYLLEAGLIGVKVLFEDREPSDAVFAQVPVPTHNVTPTGEAFEYKLLPAGYSVFDDMMEQRRQLHRK